MKHPVDRRFSSLLLALALLGVPNLAWALPVSSLDAEERGGPPTFPTPLALEDAVGFWTELFSHYDSGQVVLHDRENMQLIWQVWPLPRSGGRVDERASAIVEREALEALRLRLQRLASTGLALDEADTALLAVAERGGVQDLEGAAERLRLQRGVADQFRAGLERSRSWRADISRILRQEGVPEEILALPFVESMYNPQARSGVGARGLWQLMPATARGLGLRVSRKSDERADLNKATRAAARMLRQNYRLLGSWPLAITAYNHGPNGVRRAVLAVGSTDLVDLIDNYQQASWGFASKNFYAEFLAAAAAVEADARLVAEMPAPRAASARARPASATSEAAQPL